VRIIASALLNVNIYDKNLNNIDFPSFAMIYFFVAVQAKAEKPGHFPVEQLPFFDQPMDTAFK